LFISTDDFSFPIKDAALPQIRDNVRQNGVHQNTSDRTAFLNPARFEIFVESKHNSKHDSFRFPRGNRRRIRAGTVTIKRGGKKYQQHDASEEFEIRETSAR
ncbi:hypothetical protein ALC62_05994, partial [Cyphomyrmex costatus]